MNYIGIIIEESLKNKDFLKEVKILNTKIEQVTERHKTPWLKQWTLRAVEINAGISIVPSATVKQEMKQGLLKAITIKGSDVTRPLAIIHRKGRVLTPAMKKFISSFFWKRRR